MSIQDWGAIGELIGSIAVLATLVYLAGQVRIARRTIAAAAVADLQRAFSSVNQQIIASEEIAQLYSRGLRDPALLSESETVRFRIMVREALNGYFDLFRHYQRGDIDKAAFEEYGLSVYASIPGVAQFLETQMEFLEPELREYVASAPVADADAAYTVIMGGPPGGT